MLCSASSVFSQTHVPISLGTAIPNSNCKGFYRYLPADYSSSTKNYPLILWLHGAGQIGQGTPTDLVKILEWGTPKVINEGNFPSSFTVNNESFSFIVISPQFNGWPSADNVAAMINYAKTNYRVDPDRIYLMGISAGGGGVWNYCSASTANSNTVAAVIPFCGTTAPTSALANKIAAANLPVWAFHNTNDGTVPVAYSRNWVSYMNAYSPKPSPAARLTEFATRSSDAVIAHESWSLATLPSYKPEGINIYEWLLQYKKRILTINAMPAANAGEDQAVVIPAAVTLNGSGSNDPDGLVVSYAWRKVSGPASYQFSDANAMVTSVSNLAAGNYVFELAVTDNQGGVGTDQVNVTVYPAIPPGTPYRVLIDVGSSNSYGGTETTSPSINGNVWNNMTDGRPGVRISNALTTNNQRSGINLEVINRLDGTYSTGSNGLGNGNNPGIVNDYPASATSDHALIYKDATNGKWKITGLDTGKVYTVKFWGSRTNTTAARNAEIKMSTTNVWQSYSATGNKSYTNAAVFNFTGQTFMEFDIRTKAGSDFSCINVVDISYIRDSTGPAVIVNEPPVAKAGADTSIQLPADSAILRGCLSSDPENAVLKYKWRKVSGPAGFLISNDTLCATKVTGLQAGTYTIELTVTDTGGFAAKDSLLLNVNAPATTPWPPQVTPICMRPYKLVIIGSSTAYGTGASPIDSSWARKLKTYLVTQNAQASIINLATPGLTSWHLSPTGFSVPDPFYVDTARNITKALSLSPDAIVLSLPSNDVGFDVPVAQIKENFQRIVSLAAAQNVPVWVATTQPRNGLSPTENGYQMQLRDWINATYGNKAVDCWTDLAIADGTINPTYGAGDNVHLNNLGHHIIFTRMVAEKIWDSICLRKNMMPVAIAGNDTIVSGTSVSIMLHGENSYDPDGVISNYQWKIINSTGAVLSQANTPKPIFTATSTGTYIVELTVTDNMQAQARDSVVVKVFLPNKAPQARAGRDTLLKYPNQDFALDGSTSFDVDGVIVRYDWQQISGPLAVISNANASIASVNLSPGAYAFSLTVKDDSSAINKDTIQVMVNAIPIANAGVDAQINLPAATLSLSAAASYDPDGAIVSYRWRKLSGPGAFTFADSASAATNVTFTAEGLQKLELVVTDNAGAMARDTIQIIVMPDPNKKPVANAGPDGSIVLPVNSFSLNGTASFDSDGTIAQYLWSKIAGSAVTLQNQNNAIASVQFSAAGLYRFELRVTDNLGAIGRDTMQVTVLPDLNTAPQANAGADQTIQLPLNSVQLNGSSSSDAEGPISSYAWSQVSGPAQAGISGASQAIATVTLPQPGVYVFRLLVTDAGALSAADDVQVTLLPAPELSNKIKVNIYGGTNPFNDVQWNNWNVLASSTSGKFKYQDGTVSTAYVTTTAVGIVTDNGAGYAASSTVCPPEVLRYNSANTSLRTLTVYGLMPAKKYDLEFYAARTNTGNSTAFFIGNSYDTISTSSNVNDYAKFKNISPDATGKIIVNIRTIGVWNYLAGFMLSEYDPPVAPPAFARMLNETTPENLGKSSGMVVLPAPPVYPNPVSDKMRITLPAGTVGNYAILVTDLLGKELMKVAGRLHGDEGYSEINVSKLPKGVYIIQLSASNQRRIYRFTKL